MNVISAKSLRPGGLAELEAKRAAAMGNSGQNPPVSGTGQNPPVGDVVAALAVTAPDVEADGVPSTSATDPAQHCPPEAQCVNAADKPHRPAKAKAQWTVDMVLSHPLASSEQCVAALLCQAFTAAGVTMKHAGIAYARTHEVAFLSAFRLAQRVHGDIHALLRRKAYEGMGSLPAIGAALEAKERGDAVPAGDAPGTRGVPPGQ